MTRWGMNIGLIVFALGLSALAGKRALAWQEEAMGALQSARKTLGSKPSRIISAERSVNEMLIDLVEPERILALSQEADNPGLCNALERTARIPGRVASAPIRAEQILALDPDLV
ncbi:MAG: hypothetical protein CFK52_14015, partial [Chloracidobacterium sp. CP2_5A]